MKQDIKPTELLRRDLKLKAREWRECREPFLSIGRDNSVEISDFEEELEDIEKFLLTLLATQQITREEYCLLWGDVREEWEIFALEAIECSKRQPVKQEPREVNIEQLLKRITSQQGEIINLLKILIDKE